MRVLVTGVFDLLHAEHVRFLAAAKNQETRDKRQETSQSKNYLVVGIEPDKRVRELKGDGRPIIPENERLEMIKAIRFVDEAFIIGGRMPDHRECPSTSARDSLNCLANIKQEKITTGILEGYKKLLLEIKPDIYAVSENSPHLESKKRICREAGVEMKVVYEENTEMSTTKIIGRIAASLRSSQ